MLSLVASVCGCPDQVLSMQMMHCARIVGWDTHMHARKVGGLSPVTGLMSWKYCCDV